MECSICFRDYDLQILPMTGSCGHSFCQDCVKKFANKCPNCQRRTFNKPPKNFLAIEMIENDSRAVKELKEIKAYQERLEQCLTAQKEQDRELDMLVPTVKDLQSRLAEKSTEKTAAYQIVAVYSKKIETQESQILKLNMELFEKTLEIFKKDHYIHELEQKLKMKKAGEEDKCMEASSLGVNKASQPANATENHKSSKGRLVNNDELKMKRKTAAREEPPTKKVSPPKGEAPWSPDDTFLFQKIVRGGLDSPPCACLEFVNPQCSCTPLFKPAA